jgi:hypothetical protein
MSQNNNFQPSYSESCDSQQIQPSFSESCDSQQVQSSFSESCDSQQVQPPFSESCDSQQVQPSFSESCDSQQSYYSQQYNNNPPVSPPQIEDLQGNAIMHQDTSFSSQYYPMPMGPQQTTQTNIPTTNFFVNYQAQNRPKKFFYQPYGDFFTYHIKYEKIPDDLIIKLLNQLPYISYITQLKENKNRYTFYYRQIYNNQVFQITCEIVPPSLINSCLNKHFYGIEAEQSIQEQLTIEPFQKENLKYHLENYLSNVFLY